MAQRPPCTPGPPSLDHGLLPEEAWTERRWGSHSGGGEGSRAVGSWTLGSTETSLQVLGGGLTCK